MSDASRAYIQTLIDRIVPTRDSMYRLIGPIGASEYAALKALVSGQIEMVSDPAVPTQIELDRCVFDHRPVTDGLLCIDFGTAASKIAYDPGNDRYEPLAIGRQDGGSDPFWARSAIAIDSSGKMVFGNRAIVARDQTDAPILLSFKSKLWGDPAVLDTTALAHAEAIFTFRECIQAYLAYLTLLGTEELEQKGASKYSPRRYAMPYAYDPERKLVRQQLGEMLKRAVVLADTFGQELAEGIDIDRMRMALDAVKEISPPDWLLAGQGCVGEPVAAGNFAMDQEIGNLTVYMIADIGAGTTDFCILCLKSRADGTLEPIQIGNGALSINVAGDAVDAALVEFLVETQAGEEHRARLIGAAATIKERLFSATAGDDERIDYDLPGGVLISIARAEFLASRQWSEFEQTLCDAQSRCFDDADRGYMLGFGNSAIRVVVTGGGSALPLGIALASGRSDGALKVRCIHAPGFPTELQQRFASILADLPRLAVALGGSRKILPEDFDRSDARTSSSIAPVHFWAPFDKTASGLDEMVSS